MFSKKLLLEKLKEKINECETEIERLNQIIPSQLAPTQWVRIQELNAVRIYNKILIDRIENSDFEV